MKRVWYKESVFYHIYPLGFCGAPEKNDYNLEPVERLYKILDWIPHLKSLGVNALYLGPLFESEAHGYDTVDYFKVDRRLGTNDTLKNVIKKLHENGIRVVLDGVFNHVSRDFFAFKDLQDRGRESIYSQWFKDVNFDSTSPLGDNFSYGCWSGHFNLPGLNLKNEYIENHILNAITMWVEEFDIDGLRLDVADVLDFDFMKDLSTFSKTIKEDFWLMGEVIHGDYTNWVKPEILNSTTNYECYKGMYSSLNDGNMFEIAHSLKRLFNTESGLYKDLTLYNFVDNHDVNRIASTLSDRAFLFPLHILLFSIPGVPSIYYGSEWGVEGVKEGHSDSVIRPNLNLLDLNKSYKSDLKDVISRLSSIWLGCDALKLGEYREIMVKPEQIAFERSFNGERVVVIINSSFDNITLDLPINYSGKIYDILNNQEFDITHSDFVVPVSGMWGRILRLS
ncbi:alpha-amylase [Thiospirochaeta perfilievii]|uniref:Alpha-amylase n=1 Tax=Thiospirochaeta perfilievii TaxID=252967 RepID=A0A5C1QC73_9SPIO|nr:alpha-amylase family glycosyl hydrolase [Thiospirochaeta perfilievii]QEN04700.1 alpha-amylase [Thiospirochaeta perfilievii]